MRYGRARRSLDRHVTYIVSICVGVRAQGSFAVPVDPQGRESSDEVTIDSGPGDASSCIADGEGDVVRWRCRR
jgi:hypothetical protein